MENPIVLMGWEINNKAGAKLHCAYSRFSKSCLDSVIV